MRNGWLVMLLGVLGLVCTSFAAERWRTLDVPTPLPVADADGSVQIERASIHYKVYGAENQQPIVLLHGGLGSIEDFGGQIERLANRYQLIGIDRRGHGRSSAGRWPENYYAQMATDTVAVMDELAVPAAIFVAWSDGGAIGLQLALDYPQRVKGLFLVGAYYKTAESRESAKNDDLLRAYFRRARERYLAISPTPNDYDEYSSLLFKLWRAEPEYADEALEEVAVPTLMLHGAYEEAIDEGHARRMAALIPDARFRLLANASHFALWQRPDAVSTAIIQFVDAQSTGNDRETMR